MRNMLILLGVVFALTACGPPSVRMVRYTTDTFEPTADVEVLHTWPRDRKYFEIAQLEVSAGDQANNALIKKAREIGADAIIVGPARQRSQVYVPIDAPLNVNSSSYRGVPLESVHAIAIKFEP